MATRVFAVDLGAWSVKLAVASPGIRGATLLAVHERLVPPGDEPDDTRARRVLAGMIEELGLVHETGYIGVYGDQVFTQVLEFGFKSLRRAELDKAVGGELEGVVPVDLEDMVYTFEPIPAPNPATQPEARGRVAAPSEGMRVLTYAMRRDRAEELIAFGKECGFDPRGVLACGGPAVRLVERTPSLATVRSEGSAVAVIDIGHERTDVVVVAQGKAIFSRSVSRGGKQVTQAIAKHWSLSWPDAEKGKHSDGFIASQAEPATDPQWMKIHEVLSPELLPFARDLRQTLAACRAKTAFTPAAVLLVGGGSRLRGMASFLGEQLGTPTWRPSQDDIQALAGPRLHGPNAPALSIDSAAMTVGMAYDAAGGRPMFDLRSGTLAVKMDLSFLRAKAIPLGTAVLFIAAFAAGSAYADLYRLKKAETTLNTRFAAEREEIPQFKGKDVSPEDIVDTNTGGPGGPRVSPLPKLSAYDILIEISAKVPDKTKITLDIDKLDINDKQVEMSGTVKTAEEIDLLVKSLGEIKCFKDITRGPTDNEGDLKKFKLTISAQCM
jgi:general secretion pathway protein L